MTPAQRAAAVSNEAASIEAKLAAIAADRRDRPSFYDEILRTYVSPPLPIVQPRVLRPRHLDPAHATEDYRLPWEFFLLMPDVRGLGAYKTRATEAIGAIASQSSALTLLRVVEVNTDPAARPEWVYREQEEALGALARMPGRVAARTLVAALARLEQRGQKGPGTTGRDAVSWAVSAIADLPASKRDAWLAEVRDLEALAIREPTRVDRGVLERFATELRKRLKGP